MACCKAAKSGSACAAARRCGPQSKACYLLDLREAGGIGRADHRQPCWLAVAQRQQSFAYGRQRQPLEHAADVSRAVVTIARRLAVDRRVDDARGRLGRLRRPRRHRVVASDVGLRLVVDRQHHVWTKLLDSTPGLRGGVFSAVLVRKALQAQVVPMHGHRLAVAAQRGTDAVVDALGPAAAALAAVQHEDARLGEVEADQHHHRRQQKDAHQPAEQAPLHASPSHCQYGTEAYAATMRDAFMKWL